MPALACLALVVGAISCGKAPPVVPPALPPITIAAPAPPETKVKASMSLVAGADVNPDTSGRASPVVVRIYQLRTDALFRSADYFALLGDDQMVLGRELISRDEFMLVPSERKAVDVTVSNDTRFVGVFAAFRDNRNSLWRALIPAPRGGFSVAVERGRVVLTPQE
jgi:type VI secretion system protein VasD